MKPPMNRHMGPLKLFVVFLAVTFIRGATVPPTSETTDNPTDSALLLTETTQLPETMVTSLQPNTADTDVPNTITDSTTLSPNTNGPTLPSFANLTTVVVPAIQTDSTASSALLNGSTATADNTTTIQPPLRPEDSIGSTSLDPQQQFTTTLAPSTTSAVTLRTTSGPLNVAAQFTSPPANAANQLNPYSNQLPQPRPRPLPLPPLTQQQQQRMLSPWLFAGSDYFPYMFLLSQQQSNPQAPTNSLSTGMAPLYLTAMDLELWPWLLTQQRSQQRSQPNPLTPQQQQQLRRPQPLPLPQLSRPGFPSQNQFPQSQTRTPQQSNARNNLANLYWLNEIYF